MTRGVRTLSPRRAPAVPRRALVLGGGGVLGFAWIVGALSALESESGIHARDVEFVVGTSAGSVAAAVLACGVSVDQMRRHHQGVAAPNDPPIGYDYDVVSRSGRPPRPGLRPGSPRLVLEAVRHPRRSQAVVTIAAVLPTGRGSLAPVAGMIDGITAASGFVRRWPQRPRPWVVAVDYRTGRRVVFGRDHADAHRGSEVSLTDAVVASCSIPAWYPPVIIGDRPYIDGGTVSNASVDLLAGEPLDEVYVLAPMASVEADRPRSPMTRLERAIRRGITRGIQADIDRLRAEGKRVVLLTPGPADLAVMGANLMNSRRRTAVLEAAERSVAAQLRAELGDGQRSAGPA